MDAVYTLISLVIFALLVEFVVDILKNLLPAHITETIVTPPRLAAIAGLILAFAFHLDIFAMLGYETEFLWIAYFITGLIISAGSIPVHELIAKLRESRDLYE